MNWKHAHAQLRRSQAALNRALSPGPEQIAEAYRLRAAQLAKPEQIRTPGTPVLTFALGGGQFGIELNHLAAVIPYTGCVPVPGAPAEFLGVINLRGEIRPVLNAARLLAPAETVEKPGFLLILRRKARKMGLPAARVDGLEEINEADLIHSDQGNYVRGVATPALMIVNVGALFDGVFPEAQS